MRPTIDRENKTKIDQKQACENMPWHILVCRERMTINRENNISRENVTPPHKPPNSYAEFIDFCQQEQFNIIDTVITLENFVKEMIQNIFRIMLHQNVDKNIIYLYKLASCTGLDSFDFRFVGSTYLDTWTFAQNGGTDQQAKLLNNDNFLSLFSFQLSAEDDLNKDEG